MAVKEILKLGNPALLEKSTAVNHDEFEMAVDVGNDLKDTMYNFQERYGWGRAIAAPQIGVKKRIIFWETEKPELLINPEIVETSDELIELWDDCMSFPDLLVKLERHKTCTIKFINENGKEKILPLESNQSELIQHETDHLDGILATMRAIDNNSLCLKSESHLQKGSAFSNTVQFKN